MERRAEDAGVYIVSTERAERQLEYVNKGDARTLRVAPFINMMCLLLFALAEQSVAEYFVSPRGNNGNDGLSRSSAFATIQQGVDALEPGDTLTIGPGEYHEAVARENLGSAEAQTVIRAEIPATVLLRGGLIELRLVDVATTVQAVNEVVTLRILEVRPNVAEVSSASARSIMMRIRRRSTSPRPTCARRRSITTRCQSSNRAAAYL